MTTVELCPLVQGNRWTQLITVTYAGHDFTNPMVSGSCRITAPAAPSSNGQFYDIFPSISFASGVTGTFTATLDITGSFSAPFVPGIWNGDFRISQGNVIFGPYTLVQFTLPIIKSITPPI